MDISLATEDDLSEAAGLRLLAEIIEPNAHTIEKLRKNGNGYLSKKMKSWRQIARNKNNIVFLLTDLDQSKFPLALLKSWGIIKTPLPENFLFRIAVREVESWVMADHEGLRKLIGSKEALPPEPDTLENPREHFLNLVKKLAPRKVKNDLLPAEGAIASKGIGYNHTLADWIAKTWDPQRAAQRSPSLRRARAALKNSPLSAG